MATLTSIAPPPAVTAAPAGAPTAFPAAPATAARPDGPHRGSFANALSRAEGRHAAPRAQAPRPVRADPAAEPPPTAASAAPPPRGGKKAAATGGDDSPPDGSALPLVDAQLAAAANLTVPLPVAVPVGGAPVPTGVPGAGTVDGTLAAAAASAAAPAGPRPPTDLAANSTPAAPAAADSSGLPSPPAASGIERPLHAVPTAGDSRAPAPNSAAPHPAGAVPLPSVPTVPPVVVAAAPAPAPKVVSSADGFSARTTPGASIPAGTDGPSVVAESPRALAPVLASDTGNSARTDGEPATQAPKLDATGVVAPLAPAAPPAPNPTVAQVATPVGSSGWAEQLGDRVAVLVNQNLTNAQIKLSPAHLGPLEIRIALSDGQANIAIATHSQVTREALEAAAPKLREMLGGQGFTHVNVDVSQQQFRDRAPQPAHYEPEFSFAGGAAAAPAAGPATVTRPVSAALRLDAYA